MCIAQRRSALTLPPQEIKSTPSPLSSSPNVSRRSQTPPSASPLKGNSPSKLSPLSTMASSEANSQVSTNSNITTETSKGGNTSGSVQPVVTPSEREETFGYSKTQSGFQRGKGKFHWNAK